MKRSPEETKKYFQGKLGTDFGEVFYYTHSDWCGLYVLWRQYQNLFTVGGDQRIELLNECGSEFFRMVKDRFFEATLLSICRLSDGLESCGHKLMTVHRFSEFMNDAHQKKKMGILIKNLATKTLFARDWRNNSISHMNYEYRTTPGKRLSKANIEKVNAAISALYDIFQYIGTEFMETDMANWVNTSLNDEMVTIQTLYYGQETWQVMAEKSKKGIEPIKPAPKWVTERQD